MRKMKTLAMVLVALIILGSCDKITTDFDTSLKTTILADVQLPAEVKSTLKDVTTYPFNASQKLDVKDNSKINDYIDRLKEINVQSITATFTGIPSGETITDLNISIQSVALDLTLENLENGVSVTLDVSNHLLNAISNELTDNHEITISISGESTYAPMTLRTLMDFQVSVTARVLD